jgi:hypothetical protein
MALNGVGFWGLAGMIPPPDPTWSADQVVAFYAANTAGIRAGLVVSMLSAALGFLFPVVITMQLRRIHDRWSAMSIAQLVTGVTVTPVFVVPMFAMAAAAYRPLERDPLDVQLLNDVGWLLFVGYAGPAMVQAACIAVAVFQDRRVEPVFPRWVGYYNVWTAIGFAPGALDLCFNSGPFAWNGVFAFWIPLFVVVSWYAVMTYAVLRAIRQQAAATADRPLAAA